MHACDNFQVSTRKTSKNSDLLAASTSQKTAWLKYVTFKCDTWGANFPIKSNLWNIEQSYKKNAMSN